MKNNIKFEESTNKGHFGPDILKKNEEMNEVQIQTQYIYRISTKYIYRISRKNNSLPPKKHKTKPKCISRLSTTWDAV